jgi:hypothetical protein
MDGSPPRPHIVVRMIRSGFLDEEVRDREDMTNSFLQGSLAYEHKIPGRKLGAAPPRFKAPETR